MKRLITTAVCLLGAASLHWFAQAGEMEPPGPPAPTMVTLQQISDKLDDCAGVCGVQKTGQTTCYDQPGTVISCAGSGQDGEYKAGCSVDPRFTVMNNGTVTDNLTGLIWLQDANCFGQQVWSTAHALANGLSNGSCGLTDYSAPGDWRVPSVKELLSLIDYGQVAPALLPGHPFAGVQLYDYWASTSRTNSSDYAWYVDLFDGKHVENLKTIPQSVWPVRGEQ